MKLRPLSLSVWLIVAVSLFATPIAVGATWSATTLSDSPQAAEPPVSRTLEFRTTKQDRKALHAHKKAERKRGRAHRHRDRQDHYANRIAQLEELIATAANDEARLRQELEARLVESYKAGDTEDWNIILGGGSLANLIDRARLVDEQSQRDLRLAIDHHASLERLEEAKAWLEVMRDGEGTKAMQLEEHADELDSLLVAAEEAKLADDEKLRKGAGSPGTWLFAPADQSTSLLNVPWANFGGQLGGTWDGGASTPARQPTPMQIVAVLNDSRIQLDASGIDDVRNGRIDGRVLDALRAMADRFNSLVVTSLKSDHGVNTASGNISMHSLGCAVDIGTVNGVLITPSAQGPGSITEQSVKFLAGLQGDLKPHQVISLYSYGGPTLGMGDHGDHIHLGYAC